MLDMKRAKVRSKLLYPYFHSSEMPPYPLSHIIIMVLYCEGHMTTGALKKWIVKHLGHYRDHALESFWNFEYRLQHELAIQMDEALNDYHIPLIDVRGFPIEDWRDTRVVMVDATEGFTFLSRYFAAPLRSRLPLKTCPILRLPPELRVKIFELVLGFPKAGVEIRFHYVRQRPELLLSTRNYNEYAHKADGDDFRLEGGPLARQLSVLQVNRLFFREAMPIFYSINNLVFSGVDYLKVFLTSTPKNRLQHVRHISFCYRPCDNKSKAPGTLRALKDLPRLQQLGLTMDEDSWTSDARYSDVRKIPGLSVLQSFRNLRKVQFFLHCPRIKRLLETEMVKGEEKVAKTKASRKRKAKSFGVKDGEAKAKKNKKA